MSSHLKNYIIEYTDFTALVVFDNAKYPLAGAVYVVTEAPNVKLIYEFDGIAMFAAAAFPAIDRLLKSVLAGV